jgi:hypothetical protein
MTPIIYGVNGALDQGHIDFVSKNGFWSITKENSGLGASNLVW